MANGSRSTHTSKYSTTSPAGHGFLNGLSVICVVATKWSVQLPFGETLTIRQPCGAWYTGDEAGTYTQVVAHWGRADIVIQETMPSWQTNHQWRVDMGLVAQVTDVVGLCLARMCIESQAVEDVPSSPYTVVPLLGAQEG